MQKPILTVLIALSIPIAAILSPPAGDGNFWLGLGAAQAASSSSKKAPPVDYNAGSSLSGDGSSDTAKNSTGENSSATTMSDDTNTSAAGEASTSSDTASGAPATPNTNANTNANVSGGADTSMESVWSEPPAQTTKSKTKKKNRDHSRSETSKSRGGKSTQKKDSGLSTNQTPPGDSTSASSAAIPGDSQTQADASAGQTQAGSSVLDRPVTLGTVSPAAARPSQAQDEAPPEAKASPPPKASQTAAATSGPTGTSGATGNASSSPVNHGPDNVFTTTKMSVGEHAAPLCATRSFFQSELIRSVSWPGVGPFKGDSDPNDLVDPQENKLTLQTSGDKVTSAELILLHQPGNPQGFINLEMVMDFMLEALGAKDKKINDFNGFLEKNKETLAKNKATEEKPLKTSNGPYLISIAGSGKNNESSYLIQVKSKQSAEEANRTQSAEAADTREESTATKNGAVSIATTLPQNTNPAQTGGAAKLGKKTPDAAADTVKMPAKTATKIPAKEIPKTSDDESASTAGSADTLKQEFADTIRSWQSIKQEADKTRDVTLLAKVLTGKALAKQTVAISWLVKEKKYYEITPKGVNVDRYQEISKAPSRYAVYAHVKELSRLLDDGTNKLNKETDDQYNVNYTLEKTGDHWSIYDSQLIQPSGAGAATNQAKTPATTKPKH